MTPASEPVSVTPQGVASRTAYAARKSTYACFANGEPMSVVPVIGHNVCVTEPGGASRAVWFVATLPLIVPLVHVHATRAIMRFPVDGSGVGITVTVAVPKIAPDVARTLFGNTPAVLPA